MDRRANCWAVTVALAACGSSEMTAIPSNCTDGVQNGGELGVDCGGECAACGPTSLHDVAIGQMIVAEQDIASFQRKTQSTPPVVFYFANWIDDDKVLDDDPPLNRDLTRVMREQIPEDAIPAVAWEPPVMLLNFMPEDAHRVPNTPRILAGEFDDYIRGEARALAEYGRPVMMTMYGEMNNFGENAFNADGYGIPDWGGAEDYGLEVTDLVGQYGDPAWPDGPERVRDVFIRVIDMFRQEGAHNVMWFMYGGSNWQARNMGAEADDRWWSHPRYYYPGDDYIDFVGKSVHFSTIEIFKDLFEPNYDAWAAVTDKPFIIPEFNLIKTRDPISGIRESRSELMRQVLWEYLPNKPRFKVAFLEDSQAGVDLGFDWLFTLGGNNGQHPDEIDFWKEAVVSNPGYTKAFVIEASRI
ncbi:hypothetical protein ACFL6C_07210 [Myxococcota bacterium]